MYAPGPRGVREAQADQVRRVVRVEVLRDPRNLEFSENPRGPRIRHVDDEEGVDPPERHEVRSAPDEAGSEHALARGEARQVAQGVQQGVEGVHPRARLLALRAPLAQGRRYPQVPARLVHGELVQDRPWDACAANVLDIA